LFLVRIPLGVSGLKELSSNDVEQFLSLLRFENKRKLEELPSNAYILIFLLQFESHLIIEQKNRSNLFGWPKPLRFMVLNASGPQILAGVM
jgi:hypothetical protein